MSMLQQLSLTNFECYLEGSTTLYSLCDIEMPSIEMETVDVKGAGVGGTYATPVPGNFDSFEIKMKHRLIHADQAKIFRHKSVSLACYGNQEIIDASTGNLVQQQVKILVTGVPKSYNLGTFEPSSALETEVTLEVWRLELILDGNSKLKIDKFNYVFIVDGVDEMQTIRRNLGR